MAREKYAPHPKNIHGILRDTRLTPFERCAAVELYYATHWETGEMKCAWCIVAHLQTNLKKGATIARKAKRVLTKLEYIQGSRFDATAWERVERDDGIPMQNDGIPMQNDGIPTEESNGIPTESSGIPTQGNGKPIEKRRYTEAINYPSYPSYPSLSNSSRPDTRGSAERRQAQEMRRREEEREKTRSGFMNGASLERIYRP